MDQIAPRVLLKDLFDTAVAAADPMKIVPGWLPEVPRGRTIVVGAGKASARMALAFEQAWPAALSGVVVTPYGHAEPCQRIRVLEAAHPVPDEAGIRASQALLQAVSGLSRDDLVVALISGGGSALLPAPPSGVALADEQALNARLLSSGLSISEMNLVRRHVSSIKGGRLARAAGPARVVTLVFSDVPGDDPAQVASGPTIDPGDTAADALALVERTKLALPPAILAHLRSTVSTAQHLQMRRGDEAHVIASAAVSLRAAAHRARERYGLECEILSDAIEGEALRVAAYHAELAKRAQRRRTSEQPPLLVLSGGETNVTGAYGNVRGGRNTEFALALAAGLAETRNIHALSADTDGIDGTSGGAGGFADGSSVARLRAAGFDIKQLLHSHDTGTALEKIGDLFVTGPTRTNVNDLRAMLISGSA